MAVQVCPILSSSTSPVFTPELACGGGALFPALRGLPERWPEAVSVSLTDVCYLLHSGSWGQSEDLGIVYDLSNMLDFWSAGFSVLRRR